MAIFKCPKCGWEQDFNGKEEHSKILNGTIFTIDESYELKSNPLCEKCNAELNIVGYKTFCIPIKLDLEKIKC